MSTRLRIQQHDLSPRSFRAWLNGHEITDGLVGVTVSFGVDDITTTEMRIVVDQLDVDAETLAVLQAHVEATEDPA